ncbi:MAG TPA: NUDIX hydrolase [Armatimonadota bacterium]|jgi:8-oxo-dGTP pyrophosphatase MutT (NUDIX family)
MSRPTWQQLSSRIAYQNPWIRVREDQVLRPDGEPGLYGVIETPGPTVFVVALTEDQQVWLVQVDRYPTRTLSWEVPAGGSDGVESLEDAARRELREETGLEARDWVEVGCFQSLNGLCSEYGHVFLARGLTDTGSHEQEEEGITALRSVPLPEAMEMVRRGDITDGQTIAALTQVLLWLTPPDAVADLLAGRQERA